METEVIGPLYIIWKALQLLENTITLPFGKVLVFFATMAPVKLKLMRIGITCYPT